MKTIKHIRNTYAREQGFADWADLYRTAGYYDETKFFAHELATDQLIQNELKKKIVEEADIICGRKTKKECMQCYGGGCENPIIDKQSILNTENVC